jgi:hypothetical protein
MHFRRSAVCLLALLCLASPVGAQVARLEITDIRVGWKGANDEEGPLSAIFKSGEWSPVFIDVKVGPGGLKGTEGRIDVEVETPDGDDVSTKYSIKYPLEQKKAGETFTILTHTRPAKSGADVSATLHVEGKVLAHYKTSATGGSDAGRGLYLALGSRLPSLRKLLKPGRNAQNGWEQAAFVERVEEMPAQWFGYKSADVLILPTGNRPFIDTFGSGPNKPRAEALVEWVHRGGHLVVSLGGNYEAAYAIPELAAILPVTVSKLQVVKDLAPGNWQSGGAVEGVEPDAAVKKKVDFEVCVLQDKPGNSVRVLLKDQQANLPLVVQAPVGMGWITVVAFDLDQEAFGTWEGRTPFWRGLMNHAWPESSAAPREEDPNAVNPGMPNFRNYVRPTDSELYGQLYNYLENFEEVPVIPFSWVALFILVYIIIVGPLDYFILKKVVKRLELTWITFPTVVLVVSAAAYFTAYYLKGNDLRIRKVDLVDVDLRTKGGEAVGHTWFTLFSPRIQHYTIGLDASPLWVPASDEAPNSGTVLGWLGRPDGGSGGTRAQSFFRRSYDFADDASALNGVPIQVWSTKSFGAEWRVPLNDQTLIVADVRRARADENSLTGEITWRPNDEAKEEFALRDAALMYRGEVYKLEKPLVPGQPRSLTDIHWDQPTQLSAWTGPVAFQQNGDQNMNMPSRRTARRRFTGVETVNQTSLDPTMKWLQFFQGADGHASANGGLRSLDQTWRVTKETNDTAILVGKIASQRGPAQEVAAGPASPTRLWLGGILPAAGTNPPEIPGVMNQDTYVRIIIPIKTADQK